jgi:hypothetical protein
VQLRRHWFLLAKLNHPLSFVGPIGNNEAPRQHVARDSRAGPASWMFMLQSNIAP